MNLLILFQATATVLVLLTLWLVLQIRSDGPPLRRSVAILVLGDVGRSPRIMYHAQSFAQNDFETYIIGYKGSRVVPTLLTLPRLRFLHLPEPPSFISKLPRKLFLLLAPLKISFQLVTILRALFYDLKRPPQFILVQNPPSIPTLALVWLAGRLRGSKIIIDWHNLGYSILALKLGPNDILVKLAKCFEKTFSRSAYAHLFVTHAMRDYLVKEWDLQGLKIVLHDRPPSHFRPCLPSEIHNLVLHIIETLNPPVYNFFPPYTFPTSTPFTTLSNSGSPSSTPEYIYPSEPLHELRPNRPALAISSTSWTDDEDFSVLLAALVRYEQQACGRAKTRKDPLPRLLVIVTGKGPLRDFYMERMLDLEKRESWEYVRCRSMWLEPEDYPLLLGAADLGISLHTSSSALDLPMKIVDMFGCGLPVIAYDFKCLTELVIDGKNGLIFHNSDELANHLSSTLASFPNASRLTSLRSFFTSSKSKWDWCSWTENWDRILRPIVTHEVGSNDLLREFSQNGAHE